MGEVTGKWPIQTPFALARLVGDGTAEPYLERACPTRHFATCDYLRKMPMRENDFLWSRDPEKSVMGLADRQTRAAIAAESDAIVWGTLMAYPLEELAAAAHNVLTQLGDVGVSEFALLPSDDVAPIPILRWALDHYRSTAIANGAMPLDADCRWSQSNRWTAVAGARVKAGWAKGWLVDGHLLLKVLDGVLMAGGGRIQQGQELRDRVIGGLFVERLHLPITVREAAGRARRRHRIQAGRVEDVVKPILRVLELLVLAELGSQKHGSVIEQLPVVLRIRATVCEIDVVGRIGLGHCPRTVGRGA